MELGDSVRRVQALYPRIWHACHRHPHAVTRRSGLTEREGTLLAHLADGRLRSPADLARHLGVAPSTLSETVDGLVDAGLVERRRRRGDRRRVDFVVTDAGREAIADASPLDPVRLGRALASLGEAERRRAVEGLALIADACDDLERHDA